MEPRVNVNQQFKWILNKFWSLLNLINFDFFFVQYEYGSIATLCLFIQWISMSLNELFNIFCLLVLNIYIINILNADLLNFYFQRSIN